MANFLFGLVIAVIAVWIGIQYAAMPTFKVHKEGVIIITGASTGIGKHAALALDRMGYVVFAGVRKLSDFDAISKEFSSRSKPILLDVTSPEQITRSFHQISEYLQHSNLPLVGLVNNAGIAYSAPAEFSDPNRIRDVFNVNVFGLLDITREFLPLLRKHQGRIVNIGSVSGFVAASFTSTYSGTKFALEGITDAIRRELRPHKVAVSLVEPAYVATPIAEKMATFEHLSAEDRALYPFDGVVKAREKHFSMASPPDVTTNAIIHALTERSPHTRYVVANVDGTPASVVAWMIWFLPDYILDLLVP
jgi:short-subunit dehydrogenase